MIWSSAGRLTPGGPGDLVVFDPQKFEDTATFENQLSPPRGVRYVFVNGDLAVENGEVLPTPRGRLLRRRGQMLA